MSMEDYSFQKPSAAITPAAITFFGTFSMQNTKVMEITKDGIWVNPDVSVDDTAKAVINALEVYINTLVERVRYEERTLLYTTPPVQEFVCSTGLCRFTLTQTNVGIGERGMQAYEEAKKRGWVGISDEEKCKK